MVLVALWPLLLHQSPMYENASGNCPSHLHCFHENGNANENVNENVNDSDFEDEVEKMIKTKKDYLLRQSNKKKKKKLNEARMRCYFIPCIVYKPMIWQLISVSICFQFLCILKGNSS